MKTTIIKCDECSSEVKPPKCNAVSLENTGVQLKLAGPTFSRVFDFCSERCLRSFLEKREATGRADQPAGTLGDMLGATGLSGSLVPGLFGSLKELDQSPPPAPTNTTDK